MFGHATRSGGYLVVGVLLGSCASIVEGTDQAIKVNLSPEQASCVVMREGTQVASISRQNRFIKVSKSKNNLEIECQAPGHLAEDLTIESSASGWGVVGCILIDLCITDYSTGALNKYPEQITIALVPERFDSEQSRDDWFADRRRDVEARWDRRIGNKTLQCEGAGADDGECAADLANLRGQKAAALDRIERQRLATQVKTAVPAMPSAEVRLKTIKNLYDSGHITRQEYERKRREIVSDI